MKVKIVCLSCICIVSLMACEKHVDIEAEKTIVKALLEESISATEDEDMERLAKTFAHDDDLLFIDLSTDKNTRGWKDLKKMFDQQFEIYSDVDFKPAELSINISKDGQFAWAVYFCDFAAMMNDQSVDQSGARITYIFEKRNGKWIIVHFHYSLGEQAKKNN